MKKKMMNWMNTAAGVTAFALLTGCVSMTSMQTAQTVGQGNIGVGIGGGYLAAELYGADTFTFKAPFMEARLKYGITEKLDVGAWLTLIGTSGLDVKYQFLGNSESLVAGSAGLGVGYISITSGESKSVNTDISVPLYFSLHPTSWFGWYLNPRYTYRISNFTNSTEKETLGSNWMGATTGLRLGNRVGFLLEFSYFLNDGGAPPLRQFAGGLAFGIR